VDATNCTARRANLEDLPALKGLWDVARLPVLELEKHLTEFQVVTRPDGVILGAIGLKMAGAHGLIHSEAFYQPEHEDEYRPMLWGRLQVLARNHGLARLWTREGAPFWHQSGFAPAGPEELKSFPPALGDPHATWMTAQLREESLLSPNLEREFEIFQMSQREGSERILRQARLFKWLAALIAIGFFVAALLLFIFVLRKAPTTLPR
jgi:N-acetylglutamate synthase-like GNAT family acetyltransferase